MEQKSKDFFKNNKWSILISCIVVLALIIVFFATDLSSMVFNHQEYTAYKYAMECVKDELAFPNTAKLPSFKKVTVSKSSYSSNIIINSYQGGKSFDRAWDVSGSGKCENAMGMEMNLRFSVTVVLDDNGDFWCYKCDIN